MANPFLIPTPSIRSLFRGTGGHDTSKFIATAYGPPWNAMNGTGVTAGGTQLQPRPISGKMAGPYIIAVDPSVIPLGTEVYVWPNPFDYRGTFKADDTGGAIKGNRIDIYDPLGRSHQMAWGVRDVHVSKTSEYVRRGTAGFDQDAQHGDLGPGGPINFGGLDTGTDPTNGVLSAVGAFLAKLMSGSFWLQALKVLLGLALVIIGLARASGVL